MILKNADNSPVIGTRKKLLKTGTPDGKRTEISIAQCKDYVLIDTGVDFEFLKSKPSIEDKRSILNDVTFNFSSGQFHIKCSYPQYPKVLTDFTKYLESLVFAAMLKVESNEAKNDNKNTSDSGGSNRKRNNDGDSSGSNGGNKKKGLKSTFSGILPGSRGNKQSEGIGSESVSGDSVAKESDSDS